jgi:hypothetical protein
MKKLLVASLVLALAGTATLAQARPVFHPNLSCIGGRHLVFINGWPRWLPC